MYKNINPIKLLEIDFQVKHNQLMEHDLPFGHPNYV